MPRRNTVHSRIRTPRGRYGPISDTAPSPTMESFTPGSRSVSKPRSVVLCLHSGANRQGRRHGLLHAAGRANGVIEIGHIWMSPGLQRHARGDGGDIPDDAARLRRTGMPAARMEVRCAQCALARAAERFGFTFEGIFRQHFIVKGSNRDTAWYSIIDKEWPPIREGVPVLAQGRRISTRRDGRSARCRRAVAGSGDN